MNCGVCTAINAETVSGSEPQSPHDAQRIFPKSVSRVADTRNHLVLQGFLTAERVNQSGNFSICHCIYGEITPGQILLETRRETHAVRAAAIGVRPINAKCRDLILPSPQANGDCAVLNSGFDSLDVAFGKDLQNFLWRCVGADVPVVGLQAKQAVSDATANHI